MHILEEFFSHPPKSDLFYPRKTELPRSGSFSLFGARGTGKTSLIIEYTGHLPPNSFLYIDCQDPVFAMEDIEAYEIEQFMREEEIETLVLDHFFEDFLEYLPDVRRLVLVSRTLSKKFRGDSFELFPLDYEEFLGFDRGNSPTTSFNRFIRVGSLPGLGRSSPAAAPLGLKDFFYEKFDPQESRLLLVLSRFHGKPITAHQIYSYAKEYFRISKDWIYRTLKSFREEKTILFIEDESGGNSKMMLFDFALSRYLNKAQPFPLTFDSMVALALFKHRREFRFLGSVGAYFLPESGELIFCAPFQDEGSFRSRIEKTAQKGIGSDVRTAYIVTVSERYGFFYENIRFEALPFYEWSILNE